jgi:hypothetical protein
MKQEGSTQAQNGEKSGMRSLESIKIYVRTVGARSKEKLMLPWITLNQEVSFPNWLCKPVT